MYRTVTEPLTEIHIDFNMVRALSEINLIFFLSRSCIIELISIKIEIILH